MNDEWTPKIVGDGKYPYGLFMLQIYRCEICNRLCMHSPVGAFPSYNRNNQEAQMKRAGIVALGYSGTEQEPVCAVCVSENKITITCAICNETRSANDVEERVGSPPEFLCKFCYETVSAKAWQDKMDELRDSHQWDYS